MKCPKCGSIFNSDSVSYCSIDGSRLIADALHEADTVIMYKPNYFIQRYELPENENNFSLVIASGGEILSLVVESTKEREQCLVLFVKEPNANLRPHKIQLHKVYRSINMNILPSWKYIGSYVDKCTGEARHLFTSDEAS
jgi:hypothetical protein